MRSYELYALVSCGLLLLVMLLSTLLIFYPKLFGSDPLGYLLLEMLSLIHLLDVGVQSWIIRFVVVLGLAQNAAAVDVRYSHGRVE